MRPSYLKFRGAGLTGLFDDRQRDGSTSNHSAGGTGRAQLGQVPAGGSEFLEARGGSINDHGHTGRLVPALSDITLA